MEEGIVQASYEEIGEENLGKLWSATERPGLSLDKMGRAWEAYSA